MPESAEYFDNITVGQYALTGVPLKVYVNGTYYTITAPEDVDDPLIGYGMKPNGEMEPFNYREIEHINVSGNIVDIETYKKAMDDESEAAAKEKEEEEEKEGDEEKDSGGDEKEGGDEKDSGSDEEKDAEDSGNPFESHIPSLKELMYEITKDEFKAEEDSLKSSIESGKAKIKAAKEKLSDLKKQPIEDGVINEADYETMMRRKYGANKDYTNVDVRDIHFQTDPKEFEAMMRALGKRFGAMTSREEIADAEYELKRFRKSINYGDGKSVKPFVPGTYEAATSKLGDGPHKKARPRVNWNDKKYQEWIDSVAAEGGADHAYEMARNAKNEPGLLQWVKKNLVYDETPLERIQYDIEAMAESVNEARGRAGEELSMISKSRAKASLRQIKKGKRDDGMGKFDAKLYGIDASGDEHEITDEDEINVYKKFGLRAIEEVSTSQVPGTKAEKLTGLKKDKLKVNESVISDILIIAMESTTYDKFIAELIKQKLLKREDLRDPEIANELKAMYRGQALGKRESVNEAMIGPFVFNDKMSDDELKAMYDGALDGYSYHTKGMQYPKSDYKKAYQAIEKILKKRGVKGLNETYKLDEGNGPDVKVGDIVEILPPKSRSKRPIKGKVTELENGGKRNSRGHQIFYYEDRKGEEWSGSTLQIVSVNGKKNPDWGRTVESVNENHISEPYIFQVGDMVKNTNPSCKHFGSQGVVNQIIDMPNDIGQLIKYIVMNQGSTFKPGTILTKTFDQLEPMK